MVAGLIGSDDYTEQMVMDRRAVGDDLEAEAQAPRSARIEAEWTDDVMKIAIRAGGVPGRRRRRRRGRRRPSVTGRGLIA